SGTDALYGAVVEHVRWLGVLVAVIAWTVQTWYRSRFLCGQPSRNFSAPYYCAKPLPNPFSWRNPICGDLEVRGAASAVVGERLADPKQLPVIGIDRNGKARLSAQLQHHCVFGYHLADQLIDAALPRQLDQPCHEQVTEPMPFPVAAHSDREF